MIDPYAPPKSDLLQPTLAEIDASNQRESVEEGEEETDAVAVFREGDLLVSSKDVDWPDRCVVCNAPAGGYRKRRVLYWHHPGLYFLILANLLVYAIVAGIVRKYGALRFGVCRRHRTRRAIAIAGGWVGSVASFAVMVAGFSSDGAVGRVVGVVAVFAIVAFIVTGAVLASLVSPRRIDRERMWIKVGKPFLESFPRQL
jgi:hypothetical protein